MRIGILQTDTVRDDLVAEFGEYPDMFQTLLGNIDPGLSFRVYDVENGEFPVDIDEVDAYLVTGSKSVQTTMTAYGLKPGDTISDFYSIDVSGGQVLYGASSSH